MFKVFSSIIVIIMYSPLFQVITEKILTLPSNYRGFKNFPSFTKHPFSPMSGNPENFIVTNLEWITYRNENKINSQFLDWKLRCQASLFEKKYHQYIEFSWLSVIFWFLRSLLFLTELFVTYKTKLTVQCWVFWVDPLCTSVSGDPLTPQGLCQGPYCSQNSQ